MVKLLAAAAALALVLPATLGYEMIAHRGVFHDVNDQYAFVENTVDAMYRAHSLGMTAVELDLRVASDGTVIVVHDIISNRVSIDDDARGHANPVDIALNIQPAPSIIKWNNRPWSFWGHTLLKTFGRNSKIIHGQGTPKLESLDEMLEHFRNLQDGKFMLFLDVQTPEILQKAAAAVRKSGLTKQVYLKFFVSKAIDQTFGPYRGAQTCADYAKKFGLSGLNLVPQVNDGEMTFAHGGVEIKAFQASIPILEYLNCWGNAAKLAGGAQIPMVSASVPANNNAAYHGSLLATNWGRSSGRKTIAIVPNPDAGRLIGKECRLWSYASEAPAARAWDTAAHTAKLNFANDARVDYVVIDVMGDLARHTVNGDYNYFINNLC
ncbi:unnamed protein product [Parajaminaea phylloscopi]